jgi:hypothetical protein
MEESLKMFAVHTEHGGLYLALVPSVLDSAQIDAAFAEIGISPSSMNEIKEWQTSRQGIAVSNLRFPERN